MNNMQATKRDIASMSANNTQTIKWYVDSFFAMHKVTRSHTGAIISLGNRVIIFDSTKLKVNARSSTKSEIIAANNTISIPFWTKRLIEVQKHKAKANIIIECYETRNQW